LADSQYWLSGESVFAGSAVADIDSNFAAHSSPDLGSQAGRADARRCY
jgi:hypothetical protein